MRDALYTVHDPELDYALHYLYRPITLYRRGNCVHIAPRAFQLDEENIAYLVDPSAETDEAILDAARSCPTNAIYLDTEQGEAVYP